MSVHHLAVLAAGNPGHVSNLKYATESWTPGGTVLAVIILAVLVFAWTKIPSGPRVRARRRKSEPAAKAWERAKAPANAKPAARRSAKAPAR